ncbi:hypothetical protein I204_01565 [Kwoniella mangroviensis CBS 8886]|uniref:uncharacterized protein n=1 Tax=Kwoniella mangroviensis CBS 8507 TaxID=1296122 RepID=UPI00080D24C9|nr:uncharacterized protein I203_07470 [Kwoniella mangroviensis CBS 8507]OCF63402.1 hypothetical protein I203_07470 [Kwoniella mangroviensis CBS 8507]OCF77573.1 hypothetical protein I204_01565 [Kwoniella mangroviensis CBS 8886]
MSSTNSDSPLLPLDIRLRTLEAQLFGVPPSIVDRPSFSQGKAKGESSKSAIRQTQEAEEIFERLSSESEGIRRLLDGYDQYLPLLNPPSTSTTTLRNDQEQDSTESNRKERITESDLLPDAIKLTMVLEAYNDIKGAERDLREIDLLKNKDVQGSGNLEELLPLKPNLIPSLKQTQNTSRELSKLKKELNTLLGRYNEFTTTTSDLFIDLHHQLQYLEDRVYKLERKRIKEIKERY